jgi:hypothetical protein
MWDKKVCTYFAIPCPPPSPKSTISLNQHQLRWWCEVHLTAHMLFKTISKPQVAWTNVTPDTILSFIVFQVVMIEQYVCNHKVEWRFLQFFCLNQLVILMRKENVSLNSKKLGDFTVPEGHGYSLVYLYNILGWLSFPSIRPVIHRHPSLHPSKAKRGRARALLKLQNSTVSENCPLCPIYSTIGIHLVMKGYWPIIKISGRH